jgi:SprT protein
MAAMPDFLASMGATLVTGTTPEPRGVREMAEPLMIVHDIGDWTLAFDESKQRAGVCRREIPVIGLSAPIMTKWQRAGNYAMIKDVILHEIAHALTTGGHDQEWRHMCVLIGANPERCFDDELAIAGTYRGTCPNGHVLRRHRLTRAAKTMSCAECSRHYDPRYLFTWTIVAEESW